jgi:hypothetical protein
VELNQIVIRIKRKSKKLGRSVLIPIIQPIVPQKFNSIRCLELWHFFSRSELNHICRRGLVFALNKLEKKSAIIVETGTSAWGTDSTRLWSLYIGSFGGTLHSVDVRKQPSETFGNADTNVKLYVDDSINFLNNFNQYEKNKIDLLYLDSFDIDWENPEPAMNHGLNEFRTAEKYLKPNAIIVIDDTPDNLNWIPESAHFISRKIYAKCGELPGKGALVLAEIKKLPEKYEIIYHSYNLVIRKIG